MNEAIVQLNWTGIHITPWKLIGLTGALMFGGRWLVQVVASHRVKRPVIPRLFWYMSLAGSLMTLSYFIFSAKQDAVGVVQNLFPAFTAAYSLYLDLRQGGRDAAAQPRAETLRRDAAGTGPRRRARTGSLPRSSRGSTPTGA